MFRQTDSLLSNLTPETPCELVGSDLPWTNLGTLSRPSCLCENAVTRGLPLFRTPSVGTRARWWFAAERFGSCRTLTADHDFSTPSCIDIL